MSTKKAFTSREKTPSSASDHTKATKTDIQNYQTALKYLDTGEVPNRFNLGVMYSNAFRLSVLNSLNRATCPYPFGGSNPTILSICPSCPQRTQPEPYCQPSPPKKTDAPCD
jgi:hypothetical protein